MKRTLIAAFIGSVIAVATILIILFILDTKNEYAAEMIDLQGMRGAEATALMLWKDKLPDEQIDYWYNANSFELIPAVEPMPQQFGSGTEKAGGAVKDFVDQTGKHFIYSEKQDYSNCVIHVVVLNNDGNLQVDVDWTERQGNN